MQESVTFNKQKEKNDLLLSRENFIKDIFTGRIGTNENKLSGRECEINYDIRKSHPLFNYSPLTIGTVEIDGSKYDSLRLYYDSFTDELLCYYNSKTLNGKPFVFIVDKSKVENFKLKINRQEFYFRNITFEEQNDLKLKSGYFMVLYDQQTKFFKKVESIYIGENTYHFKIKKYLELDGKLYNISKKLDITIFDKYGVEIKSFMKNKNYKKSRLQDFQIVDIVRFFDRQKQEGMN